MSRYVALLRAINVGGHTVTMERLRQLFSELGLANVASYIQTGNVFFDAEAGRRDELAEEISRYLGSQLGYEVPAVVRTAEELRQILAAAPFADVEPEQNERLCVAFLAGKAPEESEFPILSPKGDMEILSQHDGAVFARMRVTPGKVPNLAAFVEKACGSAATVRFYGTTVKIAAASEA